mgnify:CR=1 FL=1
MVASHDVSRKGFYRLVRVPGMGNNKGLNGRLENNSPDCIYTQLLEVSIPYTSIFYHIRIRESVFPKKQNDADMLSGLFTDKFLFVQRVKPMNQGNSYPVIAQYSNIHLFELPIVYLVVPQHLYGPAAAEKLPT